MIFRPEEVSQVIDPLPIKDLCGIGSRMNRYLNHLGIKTIGDLRRFPVDILKRKFGINGQHLHNMGLKIDHSPVVPASDQDKVNPDKSWLVPEVVAFHINVTTPKPKRN